MEVTHIKDNDRLRELLYVHEENLRADARREGIKQTELEQE